MTNLQEYQNATNPKNADTDGDGFSDGIEVAAGKDPLDSEDFPPGVTDAERAALIALYNSTNGANWTNSSGWNDPAGTECSWVGVVCTGSHITSLQLQARNLTGPIPPEIGNLSALSSIYMHDNALSGPIPATIGNLSQLGYIDLYDNQLSGPIPAELGSCRLLTLLI